MTTPCGSARRSPTTRCLRSRVYGEGGKMLSLTMHRITDPTRELVVVVDGEPATGRPRPVVRVARPGFGRQQGGRQSGAVARIRRLTPACSTSTRPGGSRKCERDGANAVTKLFVTIDEDLRHHPRRDRGCSSSVPPTPRTPCVCLTRRRAFALTAIATLALGLGAPTAIFSVVRAVLLRPLPYPDADRIVALSHRVAHAARPADRVRRPPGDRGARVGRHLDEPRVDRALQRDRPDVDHARRTGSLDRAVGDTESLRRARHRSAGWPAPSVPTIVTCGRSS